MFPGGFCSGAGVAGWLIMIGFWVGFLALAVWVVTRLFPTSDRDDKPSDELSETLEHRLASGELDPDTYRHLRDERVHAGRP